MSPSGKVLFKVGGYGTTVKVVDRGRGSFALRYTPVGKKETDKALGHNDLRRASKQARELSRMLANLRASESGAPGARIGLTISELFARYTVRVSAHKKGTQPKEDARRRTLWLAVLGPNKPALKVTKADIREFSKLRAAGKIIVEGLELQTKDVKPRTVAADIVFLQAVMNWGVEADLLERNPIKGAPMPQVISQLRPMATADRAAKILEHAHQAHRLFPLFFACIRYLGWRVSAVCTLDGADFNRRRTKLAPFGEIRKDWRRDKEGVGKWVPMPEPVRKALDAAAIVGVGPVFKSEKDAAKPWSRWYARKLLRDTETFAKLTTLEGGDFHPYRRLWATERKGLPTGDVMYGGDWQDERTLRKYQLADPETLKSVMLFDPSQTHSAPEPGATPGTREPKNEHRGGAASA